MKHIKHRFLSLLAAAIAAASLAACSAAGSPSAPAKSASETSPSAEVSEASEKARPEHTPENPSDPIDITGNSAAQTNPGSTAGDPAPDAPIRVGSLKGPTSMGLLALMDSDDAGKYEFSMVTAADELVASVASGKTDIALVPANVASVLYNRTNGGVTVIDINTLGVLYVLSADPSLQSVADLKGKTVYLTGKGTTPDYVARYLIRESGLDEGDVTLEYKSEATEVASILAGRDDATALLPQPFATVAMAQNPSYRIALDLTKEWDLLQQGKGSRLVTGVTIVRNAFLEGHEEEVRAFLDEHQASAEAALQFPEETAQRIVRAGIIEKAPVAQKALPYCSITCITGREMKEALSGYLSVLFGQDPQSVGGAMPGDDFYFE